MDFTPAPSVGLDEKAPWGWAIADGSPELAQRGTQPDLGCPDAGATGLSSPTWIREEEMPSRIKVAGHFFGRLATVIARSEAAVALTTLPVPEYKKLFKLVKGASHGKITSCYPKEGGRPLYGPALPDYDHPHLCSGTIERLVLLDDGRPPKASARFGGRMSETNSAIGGHGAMRGLVNIPLVAGKTGGIRNAAQLALSLMGGARDTPFRGLCVQEAADILMHTPAAEFVIPLPAVRL